MFFKKGAIDNICHCRVEARETNKVLEDAMAKGSVCSLMEMFLVPCQKGLVDIVNLKKDLASVRRSGVRRIGARHRPERNIQSVEAIVSRNALNGALDAVLSVLVVLRSNNGFNCLCCFLCRLGVVGVLDYLFCLR
jgi:hypothetical protein